MALKCIFHAQFICNDVDRMSVAAKAETLGPNVRPPGWVVTRRKKCAEQMGEKNGRKCWKGNGTLVPPKSQS